MPLDKPGSIDSPLPWPLPPNFYARWGDIPFAVMLVLAGLLVMVSWHRFR